MILLFHKSVKIFWREITLWYWCNPPRKSKLRDVCTLLSNVFNTNSISSSQFRPIKLTKAEMDSGCMLGLDTWADTCCVGKHALINEVIEGKSVTATGFASSLKAIPNLPIVNCSLAYDTNEGRTYILRINNAIYLGEQMTNCLLCPNQCKVNNIRINLRPTKFNCDLNFLVDSYDVTL